MGQIIINLLAFFALTVFGVVIAFGFYELRSMTRELQALVCAINGDDPEDGE